MEPHQQRSRCQPGLQSWPLAFDRLYTRSSVRKLLRCIHSRRLASPKEHLAEIIGYLSVPTMLVNAVYRVCSPGDVKYALAEVAHLEAPLASWCLLFWVGHWGFSSPGPWALGPLGSGLLGPWAPGPLGPWAMGAWALGPRPLALGSLGARRWARPLIHTQAYNLDFV